MHQRLSAASAASDMPVGTKRIADVRAGGRLALQWICAAFLGVGAFTVLASASASAPEFDALFRQLDEVPGGTLTDEEVAARLARLESLLPRADAERRLRFDALRCPLLVLSQQPAAAQLARQGLAAARQRGDVDAQLRFHRCAGLAVEYIKGEDQALAHYTEAIALGRKHRLDRLTGEALIDRSIAHSVTGQHAKGLIDMMDARRAFTAAGREREAEETVGFIASIYRRLEAYEQARDYLLQSEAYAVRANSAENRFHALSQRAFLELDAGRPAEALSAMKAAEPIVKALDNPYYRGLMLMTWGAAEGRLGRHERALALFREAEPALTFDSMRAMLQLWRGQTLAAMGRHEEALENFNAAISAMRREDNTRLLVLMYESRAASHKALGQLAPALADYERFITLRRAQERNNKQQHEALLRHQFDADRRDVENRRLAAEKALRETQLASALATRRWQSLALLSSGLLLVMLAAVGIRQFRRARNMQALAMIDTLTGVANRRSLEKAAAVEFERANRGAQPLVLLALDIDHFKRVNDMYGHAAGDEVLRRVARACHDTLRQYDRLGRTGGEEFVAILPGASAEAAAQVAERLRVAVQALDFSEVAAELVTTISIGLATRTTNEDFASLLARADAALYRAKQSGRNRVEVA